jgi:hypothetical protein
VGSLRTAFVLCAALASRAFADTDIKAADALFAKGLALRETNLEQSCGYFRQSLEKNPQAIGTLMNVALCDEKLGKIASAVERFSEARDRAKEGNLPEYATEAEAHLKMLSPDVPKVTIKFLGERPAGTRVLIGERVIASERYDGGKLVNVDPGELVIVVSAPGRLAYETKLLINKKEQKAIDVPELEKGITTVRSSRKTIGIITTATGGAAFATGAVLGLVARSIYKKNHDECTPAAGGDICDPEQQSETERARTIGSVGTVVGAIGLAAAGVGVYLWLTAPKESSTERRVTILPDVTPASAGFTAVGRF